MAIVYALAADLFFAERLEKALQDLGHSPCVVDLSAGEDDPARDPDPPDGADLAIVDLEAGDAALALVRAARLRGIPVLAFGPHVDAEARRSADAAGARVVTKSQLTRSIAELVSDMLGPSS